MRDLSAQTGVDNTDPDYVNGKLINGATKAGEGVNQDVVQFLQGLMRQAPLSANGLPDNETNDYQSIIALKMVVRALVASTTEKGTVEKATITEAQNGTADKFLDADLLQNVTATESRKGIAEVADATETVAALVDNRMITPLKLSLVSGGLLTKYIEIGSWDMTGALKQVAHGLSFAKIIGIKYVNILNDDLDSGVQLNSVSNTGALGGGASYDATNVSLVIASGGLFDTTDYDGTGFNRGFIAIDYIP